MYIQICKVRKSFSMACDSQHSQEMTAQDLQMIVHGLSRAMASSETLSLCAHDVKSLANLVLEALRRWVDSAVGLSTVD